MTHRFLIVIIVLSVISCSRYHPIALEDLSYKDRIENYTKIPPEELTLKQYVIYNRDTINIFKSKAITLGYRNIKTKEIYIFQFMATDYYTTLKCDSLWRVKLITQDMGEVY